jgi:hypothetical protein
MEEKGAKEVEVLADKELLIFGSVLSLEFAFGFFVCGTKYDLKW